MTIEKRARVISQEKGLYRISDGEEDKRAEVSGKFRFDSFSPSDFPVVGDYVVASWPEGNQNAVISALFPRTTCFMRKASGKKTEEQVVAANIDTVFVCMSLNSNYNLQRLGRYIALAHSSGANPVVVLTKADLAENLDEMVLDVRNVVVGTDVVVVSAKNEDYKSVMKYIEKGKSIAFLGSSGVGKSTLINAILGKQYTKTGEIGPGDKGRHTTTRRELIALENGAFVIDTPGMRELGLWDCAEGIEDSFSDIEELAAMCRFSDCTHTNEPGCAVLSALRGNTLDEERYRSYLKLKKESEYMAREKSYMETKNAKYKEISKINKSSRKKDKYGF
ncbi:MAG: ribosome small subunit-dependent GTPase A [Candidatus Ornithospirochaeta sp.]